MSSTTNSGYDEASDERLINALPTRDIRYGLQQSDIDIDENTGRDEILRYLKNTPGDADELRQDIITGAKERVLTDWSGMLKTIEGAKTGAPVVAESLTLRKAYYYDSFFNYTDHTTRAFQVSEIGGILGEIADQVDSPAVAREKFIEFCETENELDPAYTEAADDIPAALINDLDEAYRPRLVEFENGRYMYVEYWKPGKTRSDFDIRTGDYEKINTLYRAVLRIDLQTGLIETTGDDSQQSNRDLVERFLSEFNESTSVSRIHIRGADIRTTKRDLALLTTLNEFIGEDAKLRFTRNKSGNVESDPAHNDAEKKRDYSRSNFQVIIGQQGDEWSLVYPVDLGYDGDDDVSVGDILSEVNEQDRYDDVKDLTITLDSEKATYRIQKKKMSPSTRREVFELLADKLNWSA
ncbi:hypothetical protein [Haloterrigena salifodinae]|uniref:hypothetical protein n=1 Tax=Haloterrigena salifodinae TaxID=2675099 RepID=UPI000F869BA3|nr:hypothetical protein [Haloterrigena salifodinae]